MRAGDSGVNATGSGKIRGAWEKATDGINRKHGYADANCDSWRTGIRDDVEADKNGEPAS